MKKKIWTHKTAHQSRLKSMQFWPHVRSNSAHSSRANRNSHYFGSSWKWNTPVSLALQQTPMHRWGASATLQRSRPKNKIVLRRERKNLQIFARTWWRNDGVPRKNTSRKMWCAEDRSVKTCDFWDITLV